MTPTRRRRALGSNLPPGWIFEIARAAGIDVPTDRSKVRIRCPFHDDKHPSAVLFETNCFLCSGCELKLRAKEFAQRLGQPWRRSLDRNSPVRARPKLNQEPPGPPFTAANAQHVWSLSLERVRQSTPHPDDAAVYAYLARRGLTQAIETGSAGILPTGIAPHPRVASWLKSGHRIVAPLFDLQGNLVSIQSRTIFEVKPKTRFPWGAQAKDAVFANRLGIDLLRGKSFDDPRALLGEGLTDSLAYAIACPYPALCAPGVPFIVSSIGPWVKDRVLLLAIDCDEAGERVQHQANAVAHRFGVREVRRVVWPHGAKDACATLERIGVEGLRAFLLERAPQGLTP